MKKNYEEVEVVEESCEALVERAAMGEFLDAPDASQKFFRPHFIKVDKTTANTVIGKENLQLLRPGDTTEVIIVKIDGLGYLKSIEGNPMAPPVKYANAHAALEAGETLTFPPKGVEGPSPTVAPFRDMAILVRSPGADAPSSAFGLDIGGFEWARGIYSCARTAYYQNMANEEGILNTVRFELKHGSRLYQIVWNVTPVVHKYNNGFTSGYLKFTMKRRMELTDPVFAELVASMPAV